MLLTKEVKIKLNSKTIKWYWSLGYSGTTNEIINVSIEHLKTTSHYKIECKCDFCDKHTILAYKSYVKFINYDGNYYCHKCSMIKKKKVCVDKYGVEFTLSDKNIREQIKETCIKKYGSVCFLTTNEFISNDMIKSQIKLKNIKSGRWVSEEKMEPFLRYKQKCRRLTLRNKKQLFDEWNGYDFYDGEYIFEYLNLPKLDKLSPTIDHKISIYYGFHNDLSEEEISSIKNLCITKRSINTSKRAKCFYEKI